MVQSLLVYAFEDLVYPVPIDLLFTCKANWWVDHHKDRQGGLISPCPGVQNVVPFTVNAGEPQLPHNKPKNNRYIDFFLFPEPSRSTTATSSPTCRSQTFASFAPCSLRWCYIRTWVSISPSSKPWSPFSSSTPASQGERKQWSLGSCRNVVLSVFPGVKCLQYYFMPYFNF